MKYNLFVYGTLKKGFHNHRLLKGAKHLYDGWQLGTLLDLGAFPGMIPGNDRVYGEYYLITDEHLPALDRLEGHPDFYIRTEVGHDCDEGPFQIYIYNRPTEGLPVILSGKWE